jgi:hypothetical protein
VILLETTASGAATPTPTTSREELPSEPKTETHVVAPRSVATESNGLPRAASIEPAEPLPSAALPQPPMPAPAPSAPSRAPTRAEVMDSLPALPPGIDDGPSVHRTAAPPNAPAPVLHADEPVALPVLPDSIAPPRDPAERVADTTTRPARSAPTSGPPAPALPAHVTREVEEVARRQDEAARQARPGQPDTSGLGLTPAELDVTAGRLELPRAPSPTEARPIRAIPIPEEFIPLEPRNWSPSRKVWAAAATCHTPLYFQDAVLERYGQSAEQALGPVGRCFSYPLDNPTQSNQRNQILQPFYSIGLFALQVGLLPYNLVVDPPWEAEYDLGYYRPGDRIPPDTTYLPLRGVGPPLHGSQY